MDGSLKRMFTLDIIMIKTLYQFNFHIYAYNGQIHNDTIIVVRRVLMFVSSSMYQKSEVKNYSFLLFNLRPVVQHSKLH